MKVGLFTLILALSFGSVDPRPALAAGPTATTSPTSTSLSGGNLPSSNTGTGGAGQLNSQNDNKDLNDDGADQSKSLGMAAIAAGMGMVAAGMALMANPPTMPAGAAMVAAGMAMIASGKKALDAAKKMDQNSDRSGQNASNLSNLNGVNPLGSTGLGSGFNNPFNNGAGLGTNGGNTGSSAGAPGSSEGINKQNFNQTGSGLASGIKIDPALTRQGKLDSIFTEMEQKTGINRDELIEALRNGRSPTEILANSPALKANKMATEENLNRMLDEANNRGLPNTSDVMNHLGLSAEDLKAASRAAAAASAANMAGASTMGPNGGVYGSGDGAGSGAAANRGPSSQALNASTLDALFGSGNNAVIPGVEPGTYRISPDVQAALDKNGITGRTIFQMVHMQYLKKTPLLFGMPEKKNPTGSDNPFLGLSGDKTDL